MFQVILEFSIVSLLVLGVVTQLGIPLYKGTKLFPLFRKDLAKANEVLTEVNQKNAVNDILNEAKSKKGK